MDKDLEYEISGLKAFMEEKLLVECRFFAYPFGHGRSFNGMTVDKVKRSGYEGAFTNLIGESHRGDDIFLLKRTRVSENNKMWRFRAKLLGCYDWIDNVKMVARGLKSERT